MRHWHSRLFSSPADLHQMIALLRTSRSPDLISAFPGETDLFEMLQIPEIRAHTCLWESRGGILAYALVDLWNNLWFDLLPEFLGSPLEEEIIHWGVSCLSDQTSTDEPAEAPILETNCVSDDANRIAMLRRMGFVQTLLQTVQLARSLLEPLPPSQLPAGFFFRTVSGESEIPALVELHQAAFGTGEMTGDYRLAMMQTPGYDPDLDLLVSDSIGRLVAFCVCRVDPGMGGKEGFTDPIGTRPVFRGKGLARALLLEGMCRLKARGVQIVCLDTASDNPAMLAVARSAGFAVDKTRLWFSLYTPSPSAPFVIP